MLIYRIPNLTLFNKTMDNISYRMAVHHHLNLLAKIEESPETINILMFSELTIKNSGGKLGARGYFSSPKPRFP